MIRLHSPIEVMSMYSSNLRKITDEETRQLKRDLDLLILPKARLIILMILCGLTAVALTIILTYILLVLDTKENGIIAILLRLLFITASTWLLVSSFRAYRQCSNEEVIVLDCTCMRIMEDICKKDNKYYAVIDVYGNENVVNVIFSDFDIINNKQFKAKLLLHTLSSTIILVPDYSTEVKSK